MYAPHWNSWSFGVLIQHVESKILRVFWIPKNQPWHSQPEPGNADELAAFETYVESQIEEALEPGERFVPIVEFSRSTHTMLPCPACGRLLKWEHTGVP